MRKLNKILRVNRCGIPVYEELRLPYKETTTYGKPSGIAISKFKVREHR